MIQGITYVQYELKKLCTEQFETRVADNPLFTNEYVNIFFLYFGSISKINKLSKKSQVCRDLNLNQHCYLHHSTHVSHQGA